MASYGGVPIEEFVVVHPSPLESLEPRRRSFEIGVGKVAATMGLYSLLVGLEAAQPVRAVLLCGIAGAFPERLRASPLPVRLGGVCVVGSDMLADEGVATADGFLDLGGPIAGHGQRLLDTGPFPANPRMASDAAARLGIGIVRGATVSTCSGTDDVARVLHRRSHADIESMEGAAIAAVCRRREVPLLHLRAISNWTGDRNRGEWNVGAAVDALREAMQRLFVT
jgi:futalosine hydrolase